MQKGRLCGIAELKITILLVIIFIPFTIQTSFAQDIIITDLGTLGGIQSSHPDSPQKSINNNGWVIGFSATTSGNDQAFLWTADTGMVDIGSSKCVTSYANSINNQGHIGGACYSIDGSVYAFRWTADTGMVNLDNTGGRASQVLDINDQGQIVGERTTDSGIGMAWLWTSETGMIDLPSLGGNWSQPRAINNKGHIAGNSTNLAGHIHAFLWTPENGILDLGTLGGNYSQVYALNDQDCAVGSSTTLSGETHAFFWSLGTGMIDIGRGSAQDINNHGQVVGTIDEPHDIQRAFIWTLEEGVIYLDELAYPVTAASAVNNLGQVVGLSVNPEGVMSAFLWTPESGILILGSAGGVRSWASDISDSGNVVGVSTNVEEFEHATLWKISLAPPTNILPIANAGQNISIITENQDNIIINGLATDDDNNLLTFRWLEGVTVLSDWKSVGANGEADLYLNGVSPFSIGEHILTLEVSDGESVSKDDMILTVSNSAPYPAPAGGGTYEIYSPVILSGQVADFDGDLLNYQWFSGNHLLANGQIQAIYEGAPVDLPVFTTIFNTAGPKVITLQISDGVNNPVSKSITVNIIDSTAPTLAPIPSNTILWPPNHQMMDIIVQANANDNSGTPISLTVTVSSNEPIDGLGDGDTAPDWTQPVINQQTGEISFQLRSERSGSGSGRVYTISITATDIYGNSSTAAFKIVVPHDNRKK